MILKTDKKYNNKNNMQSELLHLQHFVVVVPQFPSLKLEDTCKVCIFNESSGWQEDYYAN